MNKIFIGKTINTVPNGNDNTLAIMHVVQTAYSEQTKAYTWVVISKILFVSLFNLFRSHGAVILEQLQPRQQAQYPKML